jgi:hypothetical protein
MATFEEGGFVSFAGGFMLPANETNNLWQNY